MDKFQFAERIRKFRIARGLSQIELGERLGVSNRAVSKWERGEAYPTVDTLGEIAQALGVLVDDLIPREEESKGEKLSGMGMESIKELYRVGSGPSSSHSMGPEKAATLFKRAFPDAELYEVTLYGSLALTGVGHRTDFVIKRALHPSENIIKFDKTRSDLPHPNTMKLCAIKDGQSIGEWTVLSVGGGAIQILGQEGYTPERVYKLDKFKDIAEYCEKNKLRLWQYVEEVEGKEIWAYLRTIWGAMLGSVEAGLHVDGELFGGLGVLRKAKYLYNQRHMDESAETKQNRLVCSYAFAVSEQNAAGGVIVTAPTCGSSGVLPAVLRYITEKKQLDTDTILHALATAGIVGNLIKTNASISGAECGCQAEIGSACAMAAAALAEIYDMEIAQIEYAAEVAIEHHLGLTCDPIKGLVQIPCIERNAVAAMRAINAVNLANFLTDTRKISFDLIVQTMYETGRDLSKIYRETGEGGLAKLYL
ncbi:MAG: L-serine ammonia-lyase, iron-sulfur-dependent, subunit alpha [Clostridia bacterium]|nr:L-serine ammonia-lyase, iron-sulfur-dependent, subunit alpha [Clostridia bacterium]